MDNFPVPLVEIETLSAATPDIQETQVLLWRMVRDSQLFDHDRVAWLMLNKLQNRLFQDETRATTPVPIADLSSSF